VSTSAACALDAHAGLIARAAFAGIPICPSAVAIMNDSDLENILWSVPSPKISSNTPPSLSVSFGHSIPRWRYAAINGWAIVTPKRKQKDKVGRPDIDAFEAMMMREDCENGFFVSFDYSSDALQEIESFFKRSHKVIVALTVQEILDEHIAKKLL